MTANLVEIDAMEKHYPELLDEIERQAAELTQLRLELLHSEAIRAELLRAAAQTAGDMSRTLGYAEELLTIVKAALEWQRLANSVIQDNHVNFENFKASQAAFYTFCRMVEEYGKKMESRS